jgi:hypothetical protein
MPIVRLRGTVHPQHLKMTWPRVFKVNWGNGDLGFPLVMEAKIAESICEVACDLPVYTDQMVNTLLARAGNIVRAYCDTAAFASGIGFVTTWETLHKPDGTIQEILKINEPLAALCTAYTFPPKNEEQMAVFDAVLDIVLKEPNLLGSLMDLGDTLANFHQTPTNCGRVIDSLRKSLAPNLKPPQGWAHFQQMLRLTRQFREFVTVHSTDPRHGERQIEIPSTVLDDIAQRTWQIVNRFIEFRKRGSVQLPTSEFPEL